MRVPLGFRDSRFLSWVGIVIFGPLALGSAILWLTRKKYVPEAGSPRKDRRHSRPPILEEVTVSDPPPIPPDPEGSQPPPPSSAGCSPERPGATTPASVSTEADEGQTPWRKDGRPTAALVCGILGFFFFPLAIVAWIVGTSAARSIKRGESDPSRLGTARAGKILGIVGVLFIVAIATILIVTLPTSDQGEGDLVLEADPVSLGRCRVGMNLSSGESCVYESTSDMTTSFFVDDDSLGCNSRRVILDEDDLSFDIGPIEADVSGSAMTTNDCTNGRAFSLDTSLLFIQNPDSSWTVDTAVLEEQSASAPAEAADSAAADSGSAFGEVEAATVSLGRCGAGMRLESGEGCDYGRPDPNSTTFYVEHNGLGCITERTTREYVEVDVEDIDINIGSLTVETSSCTTDRTVFLGDSLAVGKNSDGSWTVDTDTTRRVPPTESVLRPGEGVRVRLARADWSTGFFQAALYRALLQELGYEVSDPAERTLDPSTAYTAMAQGEFDFWVNGWYPLHRDGYYTDTLGDGSAVGDHIVPVGEQMIAGGLQGFLVTKSFAEEHAISTLDDLDGNPTALADFDETDPVPGNGSADIYGCPQTWTCADIIDSITSLSGWSNIRQFTAGYDAMHAEAASRASRGEPMIIYTWTPSHYIASLVPGHRVVWLGVERVLDDSNPLGRAGGEDWDQRPGTAAVDPAQCPDAAEHGSCRLGWQTADILVTARNSFLEANPAAAKLFELVKLDPIDVSNQIMAQEQGASPADLAARWIADHRNQADTWLATARKDPSDTTDTSNAAPTTPTTTTSTTAPTTTGPPTLDDLFAVELTQCDGERRFGDRVDVSIGGTITAKRAIDALILRIEIDGTANGQSLHFPDRIYRTSWNVGDSEHFSLTEFGLDISSPTLTCEVTIEWEATGLSW